MKTNEPNRGNCNNLISFPSSIWDVKETIYNI